jgi:AraC family transcriptional regulator
MPPGLTLPDVAETTIAGGRYAVTNFKGTGAEVGPAWGAFYVAHGQRGSDWDHTRLPFEHYPRGATFDHRTGTFVCKLCIPVRS